MRTKNPKKPNTRQVQVNKKVEQQLRMLSTISTVRQGLSRQLGKSYDGQRDLYMALGYKKTLCYQDYLRKYERQDISRRIVNAYPDATWRGDPQVFETEDKEETPFEKAWSDLVKDKDVYHFFTRADRLAGIGRYSILFLGFNDGEDLSKEVVASENMELLYMTPYSEDNASIDTWETDKTSERYGLPLTYKLQAKNLNNATGTKSDKGVATMDIIVHHSRVLHIAEGLLESEVYGTPRLEAIYNRLDNLELIAGGSAEMFWRGGFPGLSFEMDPEADLTDDQLASLDTQIDEYVHSLRRYVKLQGIKANTLSPEIADPTNHMEEQIKLISGTTGIPVRILTGSERGELASTQDKENWTDRVAERRKDFGEATVLRPFINKLIESGVLPEVEEYTIVWPDIDALSDKDQAEIALTRTKALGEYVKSGAEVLVPPVKFFVDFMGMDEDQANSIVDEMIDLLNEERGDMMEADQTNNQPPPPPPGDQEDDQEDV